MKKFTVYMHVFPNNKIYVGITCQLPKYRWDYGCGYKAQKYLYNAIKKHGWENIEHIIVAEMLTKEEAEKIEIDLIKYWDTTNCKNGYNISTGGGATGKGVKFSEERKKKIIKKLKGRKVSLETRAKISESLKGQKQSQETKDKRAKSLKGKKRSEEYKRKASERLKGKPTGISPSKETREKMSKASMNSHNKPVIQYDLEFKKIKEFKSLTCVKLELGIAIENISSCCRGKRKTAGGYIWKYKKDIINNL